MICDLYTNVVLATSSHNFSTYIFKHCAALNTNSFTYYITYLYINSIYIIGTRITLVATERLCEVAGGGNAFDILI